jgi:hypothetical protein
VGGEPDFRDESTFFNCDSVSISESGT